MSSGNPRRPLIAASRYIPLILTTTLGLIDCSSDATHSTPESQAGASSVAGNSSAAGAASVAGSSSVAGGSSVAGSNSVAGGSNGGAATAGSGGATSGGAGGANAGSGQGGSAGASGGAAGASGSAGASAGAAGQTAGGSFALSSAKLTAGMAFPSDFTCAGVDHSPPFAWSGAPSGTMSFALVLQDNSAASNMLLHWALWDIPAATSSLMESLATTSPLTTPAGAKQKSFSGTGYVGPCPSGTMHPYTFTLYALDVATLPNLTGTSAPADVVAAIKLHDLASATLSATSDAKKPTP